MLAEQAQATVGLGAGGWVLGAGEDPNTQPPAPPLPFRLLFAEWLVLVQRA